MCLSLCGCGKLQKTESQAAVVLAEEESVAETVDAYMLEAETLKVDLETEFIKEREYLNEKWSVNIQSISHPLFAVDVNGDVPMQAASVIKVFILAAYLEYNPDILNEEDTEGYDLMKTMITVSDNASANRIAELLGDGDFYVGAERMNAWCKANGYHETHLGRYFMDENPKDDNYTSARDCTNILVSIFNGECVSKEASALMMSYLRQQAYQQKIPAKLPQSASAANKTGGMPDGYGLGCIENDMAIIQDGDEIYAISILSNDLQGRNDEAVKIISNIARYAHGRIMGEEVVADKKIVVIDPGHSGIDTDLTEPNGPGADTYKAADTTGTQGVSTRIPEYELNLTVSLMLRDELEQRGYEVHLTHTTNDVALTNSGRSEFANDLGADALVRIHANGSENSSAQGAMTICITPENPYVSEYYAISRMLSDCVINALCKSTGAENNGVWETDTMTGNNWSRVPTTIVEMGYMSNPEEDERLNTPEYQEKIVLGIANGIDEFFK